MTYKQKRIIVVDDSLINLITIKKVLKSIYEVHTSSSAANMYELLTRLTPDLILLNVEMPELSGYEAARFLKDNSTYNGIPVILVISSEEIKKEMESLDLGAVDYFCKPFAAPLLLNCVEKHLSQAENENIDESRVTNELHRSHEPIKSYESNQLYEPNKLHESRITNELHRSHEPIKSYESNQLYEPNKSHESRITNESHRSREPNKSHESSKPNKSHESSKSLLRVVSI